MPPSASSPVRVLFVCMGNICRSPTAEGIFRKLVTEDGLADQVQIDSAGTIRFHQGKPPDGRALHHAEQRGIDLSTLRARQVEPDDFSRFDHVIAMDAENLRWLEDSAPAAAQYRIRLLLDFTGDDVDDFEVPDPYSGGPEGFELALDLIEKGARGLLAHLRAEHSL